MTTTTFSPASAGEYADTPAELVPYRRSGQPARWFFSEPVDYLGPGRATEPPEGLETVKVGVVVPGDGLDAAVGASVRRGIEIALEEANAAGGYGGRSFEAVVLDAQQAWGAAANRTVALSSEYGVWAILGAVSDNASHVMARVLIKTQVPMINTAGTDPTLTEIGIPWLWRVRPDDRQNAYRLAKAIYQERGHERVAVLRTNARYGRVGIEELADAARRLGHPIAMEVRFSPRIADITRQVRRLRQAEPDALVLWGRAKAAAAALKQVRAAGIDVPVYGPDRLVSDGFLEAAGEAAEGLTATYPFRPDARWEGFAERFHERTDHGADFWAGYAYDGTRLLIAAIQTAGLNRIRIRDALAELCQSPPFEPVTGHWRFDPTYNNLGHVILSRVKDGEFVFEE